MIPALPINLLFIPSLSPPRIPKEILLVLYFLYSHNPSGAGH